MLLVVALALSAVVVVRYRDVRQELGRLEAQAGLVVGQGVHEVAELPGPVLLVAGGRSDLLGQPWWDRMPGLEVLPLAPLYHW